MSTVVILGAIAGVAAIISAITGVAGGVLVLSGLILCVPVKAVVPIHALVQFAAGATRMLAFHAHIEWSIVRTFILSMVPGAIVGAWGLSLLYALNPSWLLLTIALVIAVSIRPRQKSAARRNVSDISHTSLAVLGFSCGVLGMFVGSTGPLLSGWLLHNGIVKQAHIASKSVMQGAAHLAKIPLFIVALEFDYAPYSMSIFGMLGMVVLGTWLGKWCLNYVSQRAFILVTKTLLGVIVLKILISEVPKIV